MPNSADEARTALQDALHDPDIRFTFEDEGEILTAIGLLLEYGEEWVG